MTCALLGNTKCAVHEREGCVGVQSAAGASQGGSAKLMRFAAALHLDARHRQALLQAAIARNMAVGNHGCARPPRTLRTLCTLCCACAEPAMLQQGCTLCCRTAMHGGHERLHARVSTMPMLSAQRGAMMLCACAGRAGTPRRSWRR